MDHRLIYIIHMLIVFPLLAYPFIAKQIFNIDSFNNYFALLFIIGLVVFLYHGYLLYKVSTY